MQDKTFKASVFFIVLMTVCVMGLIPKHASGFTCDMRYTVTALCSSVYFKVDQRCKKLKVKGLSFPQFFCTFSPLPIGSYHSICCAFSVGCLYTHILICKCLYGLFFSVNSKLWRSPCFLFSKYPMVFL